MKRVILLIIGVIVAGIAMGQVNGNFKSVRIINSDSTHGVIPGTIYRGSDLILRWVDEAGVIHRFIKPTALGFWKVAGTTTLTGNANIDGGASRSITFTNPTAFSVLGGSISLEGNSGSSILTLNNDFTATSNTGRDIILTSGDEILLTPTSGRLQFTLGSDATGDTWYRNSSGYTTRRAIGTSNQFMTVSGGLPVWSTPLATTLNMSTARILGRTTASTGAVEEITVGTGLSLSGGSLTATTGVTSATSPITFSAGVISTEINTSRMIGRTTGGVGVFEEITVGTGLSLSGGTLSSTVAGISGLTANRVARASSATTLSDNAGFTWDNTIVTIANQSSDGVPSLNVQAGILVEQSKIGSNNFRTSYNAGSILQELVTGAVTTDDFDISSANGISTSTNGSDLILTAGSGFASGNTNGGDVILSPGSSNGSGTPGALKFNGDLHSTSVITDGTYTPTLTNITNVTASTAFVAQYMRVGNTITVSGRVDIDPTAATTLTQVDISLPIASDFVNTFQAGGIAFSSEVAGLGAAVAAETTNNRASILYTTGTDVANRSFSFSFTYLVL